MIRKRDGRSQCATCKHPRLDEINRDLYEGKLTLMEIADKYDNYVHHTSLGNHRRMHMNDYVLPENDHNSYNPHDYNKHNVQISKLNNVNSFCLDSIDVRSRSASKVSPKNSSNANVSKLSKSVLQVSSDGKSFHNQLDHHDDHYDNCHNCHNNSRDIDDMILNAKVKSIVLTTLKELGIK